MRSRPKIPRTPAGEEATTNQWKRDSFVPAQPYDLEKVLHEKEEEKETEGQMLEEEKGKEDDGPKPSPEKNKAEFESGFMSKQKIVRTPPEEQRKKYIKEKKKVLQEKKALPKGKK